MGGQGAGGSGSSAQQQAARKVTRMCITIASTFTVAWLPYQLNNIVFAYGNVEHALLINTAAKILAYFNSCVNPIIYALMWRPFRQSLIQVRRSFNAVHPWTTTHALHQAVPQFLFLLQPPPHFRKIKQTPSINIFYQPSCIDVLM